MKFKLRSGNSSNPAIKANGYDPPIKYSEFQAETMVSLFLYCFFGIGLIIGFIAYAFRKTNG